MNQTNARIICEIKCMHILRFGKSCFYRNKWSKIDMNELTRWNLNWYFWKRKREKKNTEVINECHLNKYPANACDTHRHTGNTNLSNGNKVLRCSWTRQLDKVSLFYHRNHRLKKAFLWTMAKCDHRMGDEFWR